MRKLRFIAVVLMPLALLLTDARADSSARMLENMIGNWSGTGRLTYTKDWTLNFKCEIEGRAATTKTQVDLLGKCWAGPIWSRMGAALRYDRRTRSYVGKFRDGTDTFVIDITGKPARKMIALNLRQGDQRGAMALAFKSRDKVNLKISVLHPKTNARRKVVDLDLSRDNKKIGALAN